MIADDFDAIRARMLELRGEAEHAGEIHRTWLAAEIAEEESYTAAGDEAWLG